MRAGALIVAALLGGCFDSDDGHALQRMLDQPRYDALDPIPWSPDGVMLRRPPSGTVSRESAPPEQASGAGATMLARGRDRYEHFCAPCHGYTGHADTHVARNMTLRPPPSLHEAEIVEHADEEITRVIAEGRGLMPGYADRLDAVDRDAVTAWVRVIQLSETVHLAELPPATRTRIEGELDRG